MKILIISFDADPPYMGGTATVANVLAKSFIAKGHFCALGFMDTSNYPSVFFQHKVKLVKENRVVAEHFFLNHRFDIILDHLSVSTDFNFLLSLPIGNCKIISAYHNRPMLHPIQLYQLLKIYKDSNNPIYRLYTLLKIPLLPFMQYFGNKNELAKLREMYLYSDKILLLSDKFFPNWIRLLPETDKQKLIAIGNPLVFEESLPLERISQKEKLVIAVCTINSQKRAHLLLKIWGRIEADCNFEDWNFEFVGGGDEFEDIKQLANKMKLKRIHFVGYKNPYVYYQRASIMIMTSKYEGWPMVLMEGQQMGVVPISYNSFESITDIINDGENGLIIPNNDIDCFVSKMKNLMNDSLERERMILNSIISSQRFSINKVTQQYIDLFSALSQNIN